MILGRKIGGGRPQKGEKTAWADSLLKKDWKLIKEKKRRVY